MRVAFQTRDDRELESRLSRIHYAAGQKPFEYLGEPI